MTASLNNVPTFYHPGVIVDCHTHVFPPAFVSDRERYLRSDPAFRALYENPKALIATPDDLLRSMDEAAIDISVALGFAWQDTETCILHNDSLMQAAALSHGRIVPFCTLPLAAGIDVAKVEMRRCAAAGVRGFGELRPEETGFDTDGEAGDRLAEMAHELGVSLLFHVSEPVGHRYPGKEGLALGAFDRFAAAHPATVIIGAHWGGGLPFFAAMPEVRRQFEGPLYIDTAASSLLYDDGVYARSVAQVGAQRILFGSDFPLLGQKRSRRRIEESGLDETSIAAILGGNAAELLGLGQQ